MLLTLLFYALGGAAKCSNSHELSMYWFRIRSLNFFQSINQSCVRSCSTACSTFCRCSSLLAAATKSDVALTPRSAQSFTTLMARIFTAPVWNAALEVQSSTSSERKVGSMCSRCMPNQQSGLARSAKLVVGERVGNFGLPKPVPKRSCGAHMGRSAGLCSKMAFASVRRSPTGTLVLESARGSISPIRYHRCLSRA